MEREWIDITVPLSEKSVVWPGDPEFRREEVAALDHGGMRVSKIEMSVHTGTHVDAPSHYVPAGNTIDEVNIDALVGPSVVVDVHGTDRIDVEHLDGGRVREAERLLIRTRNSQRHLLQSGDFHEDFAHLTPAAASYLASHRIRCVGIDYLSVGGMEDGDETHRILLGSGIWIIEGLDLRSVSAGEYELVCLPMKIAGAEGAPARVLLGKLRDGEGDPDFIEDALEYASKTG